MINILAPAVCITQQSIGAPCAGSIIVAGLSEQIGIGGAMRLFEILNMSMRKIYVLAVSPEEALAFARQSKDIRRTFARRMRDVTDTCMEEDPTGTLCALINCRCKDGCVCKGPCQCKGVVMRTPEGWILPA